MNTYNNIDEVKSAGKITPNALVNADCLDAMRYIEDGSVDLTVTSPPYDNLRTYNGNSAFDFEGIAKELFRVTKDGGVVVWVVGDATINGSETGTSFKQALYFKEIGFNLHDTMIYAKENWVPLTHNRYEQQWEYMFIFSKGRLSTFNPIKIPCIHEGRVPFGTFRHTGKETQEAHSNKGVNENKIKGNIFFYQVGNMKSSKDRCAFQHPAIFPLQLVTDHILSWSNKGDTIFDPFLGSGTTIIAAINLSRKFIGIEKDSAYIDICKRRIATAETLFSDI
jgi:DNA modification methylase